MTSRSSEHHLPGFRFAGDRLAVAAVAIDLDGTLLDTIHDLAAAVNLMLAERGLPVLATAAIRDMVGKGMVNLARQALTAAHAAAARPMAPPEDDEVASALSRYAHFYESTLGRETKPFPGALDGLAALKREGFRLACVTNKAHRFTPPHLELSGMASYFELVISGDTLARKKPDALPFTHTAAFFGIAPSALLVVGDSINDVAAARAAGCPVFCVPYGYNEGVPVDPLDCDGIVPTLAAIPERLALLRNV